MLNFLLRVFFISTVFLIIGTSILEAQVIVLPEQCDCDTAYIAQDTLLIIGTDTVILCPSDTIVIGPYPEAQKVARFFGDINVTGTIDPTRILFSDPMDSALTPTFDPSINDHFQIEWGDGYDLNFKSNSEDSILHLDNDGKVGIGTFSPTESLDVDGSLFSRVEQSNGHQTGFYSGSDIFGIGIPFEGSLMYDTENKDFMLDDTLTIVGLQTNRAFMNAFSDVGAVSSNSGGQESTVSVQIGRAEMSTADNDLEKRASMTTEVDGRIRIWSEQDPDNIDLAGISINNAQSGIRFEFADNNSFSGYTFPRKDGMSEQVLSTTGGGDLDWVSLAIRTSSDNTVLLNSPQSAGSGFEGFKLQTDNDLDANQIVLDVNDGGSNSIFTILGDGSVGIGDPTPDSKLEVSDGDIRVDNGSFIDDGTTLTVPDYVFEKYFENNSRMEPEYELLKLEEVKSFVELNHHLPGVQSSAEAEEKGWNISMASRDNLEKIEELFLHLIEQEEQIRKQEATLAEQAITIQEMQIQLDLLMNKLGNE